MESKKVSKTKIKEFFKKNIYFILMIVCIMAIAAMITVTAINQSKKDADVPAINIQQGDENKDKEPSSPSNGNVNEAPDDKPTVQVPTIEEMVFSAPVEGEIIKDYTETTLVYHDTTKDWRVHQGIDYSVPSGTEIKAVYDGTVTEIKTTTMRGTSVTITHANGIKSVYHLLDDKVSVTLNQKVKQGDIIGKVAEKGIFEMADGAHLHFEVMKNDVLVDPNDFYAGDNK